MKTTRTTHDINGREAGGALVMVAFATAVMATLSFSVLALSMAGAREQRTSKEQMSARYVCEAGLSEAVFELSKGNSGALGSVQDPLDYDGAAFWVEATDLGDQQTRLVATGEVDRAGERIEMTVRQVNDSMFLWAAFGDLYLDLDSNARVDSYDSTLGTYASQVDNGSGSDAWADAEGNVGSNGDIDLYSNSKIYGNATPGPSGTTTPYGSNTLVSGSMTPLPEPLPLPAIDVPTIASSGALTVSSGGTYAIAAGDYNFTSLTVNASKQVLVTGPARIVVGDFELKSNAQFQIDASAGPVELYVLGDFVLNSNTLLAPVGQSPKDLEVNLLSDNIYDPDVTVQLDEVAMDSNAKFYGTLYAPNALIDIDSNFELFGALVAKQVHLDSNSRIHYDESLATGAPDEDTTWEIVCWRLVDYQP